MKSLNLVGLLHNFTSQIFKQFQVIPFRTNRPGILDMKRGDVNDLSSNYSQMISLSIAWSFNLVGKILVMKNRNVDIVFSNNFRTTLHGLLSQISLPLDRIFV